MTEADSILSDALTMVIDALYYGVGRALLYKKWGKHPWEMSAKEYNRWVNGWIRYGERRSSLRNRTFRKDPAATKEQNQAAYQAAWDQLELEFRDVQLMLAGYTAYTKGWPNYTREFSGENTREFRQWVIEHAQECGFYIPACVETEVPCLLECARERTGRLLDGARRETDDTMPRLDWG